MKLPFILLAFIFSFAFVSAAHVSLNSPHSIIVNEEFNLYVNANVSNFDAANYSIIYPDSFEIVNITSGVIKNYSIPISSYCIKNGICRIVQDMPGVENVTGDGYLSIIKFKASLPGEFFINVNGTMSDSDGNEINTIWNGTEINIFKTIVKLSSPENAEWGSIIRVNLSIMNVTDFNCTNFDLIYNENMLNFVNFSSSFDYTYNVMNGTIKAFVKSNESMNGNFSIANITFKCVAAGESNFDIKNITVSNSEANKIPVYLINSSTYIYFANVPPVANFSWKPEQPNDLDNIQFNASSSYDLDGSIVNYTWQFGDGSVAYGKNASHKYNDNGNYSIKLIVEDDDGAKANITKEISIANVPPIANFSWKPLHPYSYENVQFNASSSYDLDGSITNYTWQFGDGSVAYGSNVLHQYNDNGNYSIKLIVEDDDGAKANITKEIIIANVPPVANFSWKPENPTTADIIQFNDLSYDNDGFIVNWTWKFGDGSVGYGKNATHRYTNDGIYNVTLIVEDDDGAKASVEKEIIVSVSQYKLTTSVNPDGAGNIAPSDGTYDYGAVINVTAHANAGYVFDYWSGDASGSDPTINIIMDSNKSIIAYFVPIQYTLTTSVEPSGSGSISLNPSGGIYDYGTVVTLNAVANSGYKFDYWGGDVSGSNNPIQITMDSNKSIIAYFVPIQPSPPPNQKPTVTITSPVNGSTVKGTITIKGTAVDDKNVVRVEIKIDNGTWHVASGTTSWSYSIDTTALSNGLHRIKARSYDGSLYSNISSISINIFNDHKPSIYIKEPQNGDIIHDKIAIRGIAIDPDGNNTIQRVEIKIDNGTWIQAEGTITWNYTWNTKNVSNGMHVIYARSYDGSLYSSIFSINVKVSNEEKKMPVSTIIIAILIIIAITVAILKWKK